MNTSSEAELAGRVILITGASRGIGRAVALACAAAGAQVIACARDTRALESLADSVVADGGAAAPSLLPLNLEGATVADYAQVAELIDSQFGRLDGLVLNAGALGDLSPLEHYDALTWARVFQVNVHSAFLLLQACRPLLLKASLASVVFTLAPEGARAKPNWGAYCVSNYALRGLMELAAAEYRGSSVRVNAVMPAPTRTRLRLKAYPAGNQAEWQDPAVLADSYLSLLGPRGDAHHGEILGAAPA